MLPFHDSLFLLESRFFLRNRFLIISLFITVDCSPWLNRLFFGCVLKAFMQDGMSLALHSYPFN